MNTQQAAHTEWTHKRDLIILVNPAKKREFMIWLALMIVAITFLLIPPDIKPLANWVEKEFFPEQYAAMPNAMNKLALEGKPDAVIWAFKNDRSQVARDRLEALAKNGNGEALFLMAGDTYKTDPDLSEKYFQQSVAAGYPQAVKWQMERLRREAKDVK